MRCKEHFFAETVARRPTFCNVIVVKFFNQARNRAHARPKVFEEDGGAVSSQTSELCPLLVSVACSNGIAVDTTHGSHWPWGRGLGGGGMASTLFLTASNSGLSVFHCLAGPSCGISSSTFWIRFSGLGWSEKNCKVR
jgi:hypothetical protein